MCRDSNGDDTILARPNHPRTLKHLYAASRRCLWVLCSTASFDPCVCLFVTTSGIGIRQRSMADLLCHRSLFSCKDNKYAECVNQYQLGGVLLPVLLLRQSPSYNLSAENTKLLFLTFSVIMVVNSKKLLNHDGQSRSMSAEHGKKRIKEKVWQHTPPPPPMLCGVVSLLILDTIWWWFILAYYVPVV